MSKILLISGFNTHPEENDGVDIYIIFKIYYMFSGRELDIFRYKTDELLNDVYQRMCCILDKKTHDLIITHSMGSGLFLRYIYDYGDDRKAIICQPYIQATAISKFISNIPFVSYIKVPKCIAIPNHMIAEGGNILNDKFNLINFAQPYTAINSLFLSEDDIVNVIKKHKHIRLIYSDDERVSPMSDVLIKCLSDKIIFVPCKHVPFINVFQMNEFYEAFTEANRRL
jgi:hypothetical protein